MSSYSYLYGGSCLEALQLCKRIIYYNICTVNICKYMCENEKHVETCTCLAAAIGIYAAYRSIMIYLQ